MTNKRAQAIGSLILTIVDLSEKRGAKAKIQKIVGKRIFYESDFRGRWMIGNTAIVALTTARIEALTKKLKTI